MTQTAPFHRRSPSSSPHAFKSKSARPVLHRRGTSSVNVSISKLGSGPRGASKPSSDETEFDMASFLNFCAMCENQITVPNNTLLYCSESCRRKDSCKPLSASQPSMSSMSCMSSTTTPPTSPPLSPRTIVAPMTPTRIPSHVHDAKSDLDPTEWKPVILRSSSSLSSSDAWNYLSQFHRGGSEPMLARPAVHRSTSSLPGLAEGTAAHSHVPCLTNTPSTVASSFNSTASDYLSSMYEVQRPLPPRHNPCFSGTSVTKGVDLVVPHVVSPNEDPSHVVSNSGSIFPASSAVWVDASCENRSAPISMTRDIGGRPVETCSKN